MPALYIHWPFCASKCPYCDFNSHVRDAIDAQAWSQALRTELNVMAGWIEGPLTSIFFGGGTPSLMPPALAGALIEQAEALCGFAADIEITLEANPTTAEAGRFRDFKAVGINRLSLGIQSLRDDQLAFLGRTHGVKEARRAIDLAAATFERRSFDLIYARPGQTLSAWEAELGEALALADGHLSLYQLTIEPNTAFHHLYHRKRAFDLPVDDEAAQLYELTQAMTEAAGMPSYEISNHARPGEESRHNLSYWRGDAYLGVGPGAHGRVRIGERWHATATLKSPERWLETVQTQGHGLEEMTPLSPRERAEERLMMGLRLREGVAVDEALAAVIDPSKSAQQMALGLLERNDNRLVATAAGMLVLNRLIAELLRL